MTDAPDAELLEQFARNQSEAAFAELVERHIGLVYSTAFRKTGNPQQAQDITQAVFIILARKANSLGRKTVLPGWLYHTARLTAANLQRAEWRRMRREQEASMQSTMNESAPDVLWRELSPLLEDAMAGLGANDRDAIVLRYFQNRSMAEVGAALGTGEDAAKMRVSRALEKLRKFFNRRGIVSTAAIVAGAITNNSVQAAPAGLAQTISAVAVAKGAAASASTLTLVKGALKLMAWTNAKTAIVGVAVALLAIGGSRVALNAIVAARTAAALATMQGSWEGTFGPHKARAVFTIFQTNGIYRATIDSIDEGLAYPIPKLWANSHWIHAENPALPVDYRATLNSAGTVMTGTVKTRDTTLPLVLKRTGTPDTILTLSPQQYARRADSPLQGEWAGTLKHDGDTTRFVLRIAETAPETFQAVLDLPDDPSSSNIRVRSLAFDPPTVQFKIGGGNDGFRGNLSASDDELAGTFTWNRGKYPLQFERVQTNTTATAESVKDYLGGYLQIQGHWKTTVRVAQAAWSGKTDVHVVFNIAQMPDGTYSATLDLPDQGAKGVPATSVEWTYPNVRMKWQQIDGGSFFTGKLESGRLSGAWHQDNVATPLQLQRGP